MEQLIKGILTELGEDPEREGLLKTPERVNRSLRFLTQGYAQDPHEIITKAIFTQKMDEMVLVKNIDFYSLCEHHMLPFFGKCHIAYLPDNKIVGLSKLARLVEVYSRRLQVQERLTQEIAHTLQEHLKPKGVAVITEAQHLCMQMRGVQKQNSTATASSMIGLFKSNPSTRSEFLNLVKG